MISLYNYKAKVLKIVDGDTINFEIDMGIRAYLKINCRLSGINAPELRDPEPAIREKAQKAKEYLAILLPIDTIVDIYSKSLDKYGRPIVEITKEGISINQEMLTSGNAVVYK